MKSGRRAGIAGIAGAVALALAACGPGDRTVAVQATERGPDSVEAPISHLVVVALPYDRDSLRAALAKAGRPRPSTAALDSLFAEFREPFVRYSLASARVERLRDSLETFRRRGAEPPASLATALAETERARDSVKEALDRARTDLIERDSTLRAPIRAWEDTTFAGWDTLTKQLQERSAARPAVDTTDAAGWAELRLRGGHPYWIWATSLDVYDPNASWYWNVPATGDTIRLTTRNATHRPRY